MNAREKKRRQVVALQGVFGVRKLVAAFFLPFVSSAIDRTWCGRLARDEGRIFAVARARFVDSYQPVVVLGSWREFVQCVKREARREL